ncbi:MAG: hypothetical protein ABSG82_03600 [Sedimentisphaerales bacterium]|jgi:hypothetical protein
MIEILGKLEHRAAGLPPVLLVAAALVTIAAGLFICFGGLGCKKTLFVLIGAYCGAAFAISFNHSNLLLVIAVVGFGILLALKYQGVFLVLLAAILGAIYGFSTLIKPYVNTSGEPLSMISQLVIGVPSYNWLILICLIAVPFAAGSVFWWGTSVVLCSAAGAAIMLVGAIMFLVRNGGAAAEYISDNRELCLGFFAAVTILGAITQWLLLPKFVRGVAVVKETIIARVKKDKTNDGEAPSAHKTATWRTA